MTQPELRTKGSLDYFDEHWAQATASDFAYPREVPRTQWDLFEREKARLLARFLAGREIADGSVLEYGCGSAGMSVYLANQGFRALATDLSLKALAAAQANWLEHRVRDAGDGFVTARADTFRLPFEDGAFDIAMSYGLLEHFDPEALRASLAETFRVLRPGGIIMGDIVPDKFSSRKVAVWLSLTASLLFHALRGRFRRMPAVYAGYADPFYENTLNMSEWEAYLAGAGFAGIHLQAIRAFPPLPIAGGVERSYVALMEKAIRFSRWFDAANTRLTRTWAWTYLFWAEKPGAESRASGP
jgi:SAM-dependent methyltransferase